MEPSKYIAEYLRESKAESSNDRNPPWARNFLSVFHRHLSEKYERGVAPGDRYPIASAFGKALPLRLPDEVELKREVRLKPFLEIDTPGHLSDLLCRKSVDFELKRREKRLLIEFKSNLQFNDLAAAVVEMAAVKRFTKKRTTMNAIFTSSLHLFPFTVNIAGLRALNDSVDSPLDFIWVLCRSGKEVKFNIEAIEEFRADVNRCLS